MAFVGGGYVSTSTYLNVAILCIFTASVDYELSKLSYIISIGPTEEIRHGHMLRPYLVGIMAFSPLCRFAPWLIRPAPVEYTGDSLLRLVFQFTERQQVSVASRH